MYGGCVHNEVGACRARGRGMLAENVSRCRLQTLRSDESTPILTRIRFEPAGRFPAVQVLEAAVMEDRNAYVAPTHGSLVFELDNSAAYLSSHRVRFACKVRVSDGPGGGARSRGGRPGAGPRIGGEGEGGKGGKSIHRGAWGVYRVEGGGRCRGGWGAVRVRFVNGDRVG